MTLIQLRRALVAIATVVTVVAPGTAHAQTDLAIWVGNGTYAPGLPITGCADQHDINFTGTMVVVGDHAGTYSVSWHGNSRTCSTWLDGDGDGSIDGDASGNAEWQRTGSHSNWKGDITLNGVGHVIIEGNCEEADTSFNPVTSFTFYCWYLLDTV